MTFKLRTPAGLRWPGAGNAILNELSRSTDQMLKLPATTARLCFDNDGGSARRKRRKRYIKGRYAMAVGFCHVDLWFERSSNDLDCNDRVGFQRFGAADPDLKRD